MPTILQLDNFALCYVLRYLPKLPQSTILIVDALQHQQRTANRIYGTDTEPLVFNQQ